MHRHNGISLHSKEKCSREICREKKDGTGKYSIEVTPALKHNCCMFSVMCRSFASVLHVCACLHMCTRLTPDVIMQILSSLLFEIVFVGLKLLQVG